MGNEEMNLRQWAALVFRNPEPLLRRFAKRSRAIAALQIDPKLLRDRRLKPGLELRQACLFAWGLKHWMPTESVSVAMIESADYDAVFRWQEGDTLKYRAVQLKELVGERWNADASLQKVIDGLAKYRDSKDLSVGIFCNRLSLSKITFEIPEGVSVGQLFLFGSCSLDGSEWFTFGNLMEDQATMVFYSHPSD